MPAIGSTARARGPTLLLLHVLLVLRPPLSVKLVSELAAAAVRTTDARQSRAELLMPRDAVWVASPRQPRCSMGGG